MKKTSLILEEKEGKGKEEKGWEGKKEEEMGGEGGRKQRKKEERSVNINIVVYH